MKALQAILALNESVTTKDNEAQRRQQFIDKIESYFGTLDSIPFDKVSTAHLRKMYNTLLSDNLIKPLKESLNEGTWSMPDDVKKAKALKALISKSLPAKGATKKLYDLLGDDELFDEIDDWEQKDGDNVDVSDLVRSVLNRRFMKHLPKECQDILKEA